MKLKYRKILAIGKKDAWYEDRKRFIGKWVTPKGEDMIWTIPGAKGYHCGYFLFSNGKGRNFFGIKLSKEVREL